MKIKRYSNTKAQKTERWNDRKIQSTKIRKKNKDTLIYKDTIY